MLINEISSQELAEMMQGEEPPRLIDVRSAAEVLQGALSNAEHIVMHVVPLKMQEFDKDKPIVFYCRTGARSAQVCYFLKQQGFDNAINLRGGIMDWVRSGYEAVSGDYMLNEAV
jgi:rhodanese-related sulfurtransferase